MLATRAGTCSLYVRARYLFVRARLLFKNVRPGQQRNILEYMVVMKIKIILSIHANSAILSHDVMYAFSQNCCGPLWFKSLCAKLFLETTDLHLRQLRIVSLYQTIHSFQLWHCKGINFDKVLSCSNFKSHLLRIIH